jgi:hypothetical protein
MSAANVGRRAKAKGTNYERDFAKRLSSWWTYGNVQDSFWRTSLSGGKATVNHSDVHVGDICAIRPVAVPLENCVVFELKRGYNKSIILDWLLLGAASLIGQWWEKGYNQAAALNRKFILIVKHDHYPEIAFMLEEQIPGNPPRRLLHNGGIACFVLEEVLWHQDPLTVANLLLDPKNLKSYEKESRRFRNSTTIKSMRKSLKNTSTVVPLKKVVRKRKDGSQVKSKENGGGLKSRTNQPLNAKH